MTRPYECSSPGKPIRIHQLERKFSSPFVFAIFHDGGEEADFGRRHPTARLGGIVAHLIKEYHTIIWCRIMGAVQLRCWGKDCSWFQWTTVTGKTFRGFRGICWPTKVFAAKIGNLARRRRDTTIAQLLVIEVEIGETAKVFPITLIGAVH